VSDEPVSVQPCLMRLCQRPHQEAVPQTSFGHCLGRRLLLPRNVMIMLHGRCCSTSAFALHEADACAPACQVDRQPHTLLGVAEGTALVLPFALCRVVSCRVVLCCSWKTYRSDEPLRGFVQQVLKANNLAEDTSIPIMPVSSLTVWERSPWPLNRVCQTHLLQTCALDWVEAP